ncbi:hypothetical protein OH77DRAFT_1524923 [Trametes cingulata]|nr:hypothetical protein OH77DRAFT_1524923 [Trametes cingulata]
MGRRRKPIILSDDELASDSEHGVSAAVTADSSIEPGGRGGTRKTKAGAKKAWESLIPGKKKSSNTGKTKSKKKSSDTRTVRHTAEEASSAEDAPAQTKAAKMSRQSYRAPQIDPDASDEDSAPPLQESARGSTAQSSSREEAAEKPLLPPKFWSKQNVGRMNSGESQEGSSDEEQEDEEQPSDTSDQSEEDDARLEEMEKNPRALEKMFADEAAYWANDDSDNEAASRSRPSGRRISAPRTSARASLSPFSRSQSRTPHTPQPEDGSSPPSAPSPRRVSGRHTGESTTKQQPKKRAAELREDARTTDDDDDLPPKKAPKTPHNESGKHNGSKHKQGGDAARPTRQGHGERNTSTSRSKARAVSGPFERCRKRVPNNREDEIPALREPREEHGQRDGDSSDDHDNTIPHKCKKAHKVGNVRTKRSRHQDTDPGLDVSDASLSNSDSSDSGIDIVLPERGKLKLDHQHQRVRRVLERAIFSTLSDVALKNAFPDGLQKHGKIVYRALLKAAAEFGYEDMVKRLKKQDQYVTELSKKPIQRIPTFRGHVRKVAEGQPATAFGLTFGDKEKGDWLQHGRRALSPPVFVETLRTAFFKRPNSLGFKIADRFESTLPEKPDEKEIPAAMLALVATAFGGQLHAAIQDSKQGYTAPRDFTTNEYWGVYKDHIQELSTVRMAGPVQYHVLMHGLWRQISDPLGTRGHAGPTGTSFLNVQDMARE